LTSPRSRIDNFFRLVWRWHFWAGLIACPVLLVLSATGGLYTFRDEIEDERNSELVFVNSRGERKPLSEQLTAVKAGYPESKPVSAVVRADAGRSTIVAILPPPAGADPAVPYVVYVDPCTEEILGGGPARSPFFAGVLKLHRSLFAGIPGRIVTELTTSWTVVLLASGLYLWWAKLRIQWLPRLRANRYTALRDLHSLTGVIVLPAIALLAVTGLFFSVVWLESFNAISGNAGNFPPSMRVRAASGTANPVPVDSVLDEAIRRWPGCDYTVALPSKPGEAPSVTIRSAGSGTRLGTLQVDPATGDMRDIRAENLSLAEQARLWVFPVHTGSVAGTPTKILALLACFALSGLATSGVWMWLIRRGRGRTGFPRRPEEARIPKPAVMLILILAVAFPTVGLSLIVVLLGEWLYGITYRNFAHISSRRMVVMSARAAESSK